MLAWGLWQLSRSIVFAGNTPDGVPKDRRLQRSFLGASDGEGGSPRVIKPSFGGDAIPLRVSGDGSRAFAISSELQCAKQTDLFEVKRMYGSFGAAPGSLYEAELCKLEDGSV